MKVFCPVCNNVNLIPDDEASSLFSFLCEKCSQLLSVKVVVQALQVVKTGGASKKEKPGTNRVSDYIRSHMGTLNLPVLPILARKVKQASENPRCSISDIVTLVKTDQIIASKILELANSAAYGGLVEITDLKRAIIKLGLSTTEMLVQALENKRIYRSDNKKVGTLLKDLWLHALGVGLTAQTIAKDLKLEDNSAIFTAGLLHDFGYILFVQALLQAKGFKVDLSAMNTEEFMEVAFEDHTKIGALYLKNKGLPQSLVTIVAHHEEIPPSEVDNKPLHVVALANQLCKKVGLGPVHEPDTRLELSESAQVLGFNELKLADLEVTCEDRVKVVAAAME